MRRFFFILTLAISIMGCSKKEADSPFAGSWTGGYFADNIYFGAWNILIDKNGNITGKIVSSAALQSYEFGVVGSVGSNGSIVFNATISPTIDWKFEGALKGTAANGSWTAQSIPGNPPGKVWTGNKQ